MTWKTDLRTKSLKSVKIVDRRTSSIETCFQNQVLEEERKFQQELRAQEEQIKVELVINEESREDVD